jgi:hypothetical protein
MDMYWPEIPNVFLMWPAKPKELPTPVIDPFLGPTVKNLWANNVFCNHAKLNKTVLDWFQDSSKTGSGINFCASFLAAFCRLFPAFFANFFCRLFLLTFFAAFFCRLFNQLLCRLFGPAFWGAFLSGQFKCRTILSMQYKSLLHVFFFGGGECKSLS